MEHVKIGVDLGLWRLGMPTPETILMWPKGRGLGPRLILALGPSAIALPRTGRGRDARDAGPHTSRIELGPSVLLLNLRHPLVVAKSFATLDYYSHGRMVMAVGTGANLADYAATGIALESRGRRLDEGVEVLRKVWTQSNVSHHGRFFNFDNVTLSHIRRGAPTTTRARSISGSAASRKGRCGARRGWPTATSPPFLRRRNSRATWPPSAHTRPSMGGPTPH